MIKKVKNNRKKSKNKKQTLKKDHFFEIIGIFLFIFAIFCVSFLNGTGGYLGKYANEGLLFLFGIGSYVFILILFILSIFLFFTKEHKFGFYKLFGIFLFFSSILSIINLGVLNENSFVEMKENGGLLGFIFSYIFRNLIGDSLSYLFFLGNIIISLSLIVELSFKEIYEKIFHEKQLDTKIKRNDFEEAKIVEFEQIKKEDKKESEISIIKPISKIENPENKNIKRISKNTEDKIKITNFVENSEWKFPSLDLLSSETSNIYPDDKELKEKAENIKKKLSQFGVNVEIIEARVGPSVTQFTLKPEDGVKVSKIASLKDDLALSLSAQSLRIEAPIPGQPYVGIEIPNDERANVFMKEILESESFAKKSSKLKITLGKDVSGKAVVEDLAKMPHLLIAGATGAGKSVGMNSFLISLLYQNSPKELKFIMIDPKRVELDGYNGIPHLLTPVITDAGKAVTVLKWAVTEMMRRYSDLQEKGYRNIGEYNEGEENKMPKIVIVIDELADLMMRESKKETESSICRLAQMARAVGMHLIIATQRPSVDVITGLIKANIPTRISFTVTSSIDSRTIIDSVGAEELLGMGDMLFSNSSLGKAKRIQGIYISGKEITKVVNHIKTTPEGFIEDEIVLDGSIPGNTEQGELEIDFNLEELKNEDDKIIEAIEVIKKTNKASATLLQRMISVGYARAAKILDILESKGMIGPARGAKAREIYLDKF